MEVRIILMSLAVCARFNPLEVLVSFRLLPVLRRSAAAAAKSLLCRSATAPPSDRRPPCGAAVPCHAQESRP